jgi:hypothetical protein
MPIAIFIQPNLNHNARKSLAPVKDRKAVLLLL